jgi:cell wall-associated NlpC family hydrolase
MIAQPGRILPLFMMLVLSACGSSPTAPDAKQHSPGERAAAVALDQVGVRYRYGGSGPQGFDCSGLVHYAYAQAGVAVPRTTGQLWAAANDVDRGDLRAGDLLFFSIEGKMSHVGMYLGKRRFVHAPQSGRSVSVASLDAPFYRNALLRAGRIY